MKDANPIGGEGTCLAMCLSLLSIPSLGGGGFPDGIRKEVSDVKVTVSSSGKVIFNEDSHPDLGRQGFTDLGYVVEAVDHRGPGGPSPLLRLR